MHAFPTPFPPTALAVLVALAWPTSLRAQTTTTVADAPHTVAVAGNALKEVVISGSRNAQSSEEVPASIDVLGGPALENQQVRDIRDTVREWPNVSVQRAPSRFNLAQSPTGRSGNTGFNIRGLEGNRVLLLVDGLRLPRAYNFNAAAFGRDYMDLGLVQRVELLKGSASALYGSDGVAGLVNFITAEPADFLHANKALGGQATLRYGTDNNSLTAGATLAGRASDTVQWLIAASTTRARELDNLGNNSALNGDRTTPNPQKDRGQALLGKLVLQPDGAQKHTLSFEHVDKRSAYDVLSARAKPPLAATSALQLLANDDAERSRLTWDTRWRLDGAMADRLQAMLSYQDAKAREYSFEDRNTAADRVRDTRYTERTLQMLLQFDKTVPVNARWTQKITYGVDYTQARLSTLQDGLVPPAGEVFPLKRFPDTRESTSALFIQDEFASDVWSITPGLRFDRYRIAASQAGFSPPSPTPAASLSGSAASPKLALLFRAAPGVNLYAHYAGGFKAPNADQINGFFENITGPGFFYRTIPNPGLKAETSRTVEIGAKGRLDRLAFDVAAFAGRYRDFIEDRRQVSGSGSAADPVVFQSVNFSNVRIRGFEFKGTVDWGRAAGGQLSTPFSYGQTTGYNTANGAPLNSIDPARLFVALQYETPAWQIRLGMTHRAAKDRDDIDSASLVTAPALQYATPSATVFDLSGQWRIRKDVRLTAALYNLTDRKVFHWSDVRGLASNSTITDAYSQPGRHLVVSLVTDF